MGKFKVGKFEVETFSFKLESTEQNWKTASEIAKFHWR